jgi:hypothetical protein
MADKKRYRVLCWGACESTGEPCGINYPPERRAVEGDVVSDLPVVSIPWLLEVGWVEELSEKEVAPDGSLPR